MKRLLAILAALLLTSAADAKPRWTQSGWASWYGPGFEGRRAACGRHYHQNEMTAAHKSLPCGTKVEVRANGRKVVVTITDRGPYARGRIIDLSRAAAAALGMRPGSHADQGVARATVSVLGEST